MAYQHSFNIFLVLVLANVISVYTLAQKSYGKLNLEAILRLYEFKIGNVNNMRGVL